MKKILAITVLLSALLFTTTSCGGDDDNAGAGYNPVILGTWNLASVKLADGTIISTPNCDQQLTWEFTASGLGTQTEYVAPASGTNCEEGDTTNFNFGMDVPNQFTVRVENELSTYNYELTADNLAVSEGTVGTDMTYYFEKQN